MDPTPLTPPLLSFGRGSIKIARRGKKKQSLLLVVLNRPTSFNSINNDGTYVM